MIRFLFKGLIRDQSRSRLPIIVVAIGVMLTVFMHAYITGMLNDTIEMNARFFTGHVKVITKAYEENIDQNPNDLALINTPPLLNELNNRFKDVIWVERIHFGGLIDAPDSVGETRAQGPVMGMAVDLMAESNDEINRLNIAKSLVRGNLPRKYNEVLISDFFSRKLNVNPGDEVTFIGSTMYGGMAYYNFVVSGTLSFGVMALDRGTIIADIEAVREALNMEGAAGEISGFLADGYYSSKKAGILTAEFNGEISDASDVFSPVMVRLEDQAGMDVLVDLSKSMVAIVSGIFIIAMSLVLWNAGLLGGLRRYGEIGIRLAMGEEKKHVFLSMIYESVMIGVAGSVIGTSFGLFFAWLLQTKGIDISSTMKGTSMMVPSVIRARISAPDFYIGFLPGVVSTLIGTALAGIGIFKRQTAKLFKELEA